MSEHASAAKTKPKTITIEVNNKPYQAPKREMSGAEIKALAGVPLDFQLYLLHGSQLDLVSNEKVVKLHNHDRFRAVSGQDVS